MGGRASLSRRANTTARHCSMRSKVARPMACSTLTAKSRSWSAPGSLIWKRAYRLPATRPCWDRSWRSSDCTRRSSAKAKSHHVSYTCSRETSRQSSKTIAPNLLLASLNFLGFSPYHGGMAALPQQPVVLSFEEARRSVEQHAAQVRPRGTETVDLLT